MKTNLVKDLLVPLGESNGEEAYHLLNTLDEHLASFSLQDLTIILAELRRHPAHYQKHKNKICLEVLHRWEWAASTDLKLAASLFSVERSSNKRLLVESLSEFVTEELALPSPDLDRLSLMAICAAKQKHFARLGKERENTLYVKLVSLILRDFNNLEPRQLARLANAATRRPHRQHEILDRIHKAVSPRIGSCDVRSLIAFSYAFSFHKIGGELFFQQADSIIAKTLPTLRPYFISLAAHAFTREFADSSDVFTSVIKSFRGRAKEFGHNELSRLARSFTFANHDDPRDLRLLVQCVALRITEFRKETRRELLDSLSAFSDLLGSYGDALRLLFISEELENLLSQTNESLNYEEIAHELVFHSPQIPPIRKLHLLRAMRTLGLFDKFKSLSQSNWQKFYSENSTVDLSLDEQAELLSYLSCDDPAYWAPIFQELTRPPGKSLDTMYQILSFAPETVCAALPAVNIAEYSPLDCLTPRQWVLELWFYKCTSQHDKSRREKLIEQIFSHLDWLESDIFLITIWACKKELICDANMLVKTAIEIELRIDDFDFHELLILGQFLTQERINLGTLAAQVATRAARFAGREHSEEVSNALRRINSTSDNGLEFLNELLWEKVRQTAADSKRDALKLGELHHITIIRKFSKLLQDGLMADKNEPAIEFEDIQGMLVRNWYREGRNSPLKLVAEYAQLIPICCKLGSPSDLLTFAQDVEITFQSRLDKSCSDTLLQLFPKLAQDMFEIRNLRESLFRGFLALLDHFDSDDIKKYLSYFAPLSKEEVSQIHEVLSKTILMSEISSWDANLHKVLTLAPDSSRFLKEFENQLLQSVDRLSALPANRPIKLTKPSELKGVIERLYLRFSTHSFMAKQFGLAKLFLLFSFSLPPLLTKEILQDKELPALRKLKMLRSMELDKPRLDRCITEIISSVETALKKNEKISLPSIICELIDLFPISEQPESILEFISNSVDYLHIKSQFRVLSALKEKRVISKEPLGKLTKQILTALYNCAHSGEEILSDISDSDFFFVAGTLVEDVSIRARNSGIKSEELVAIVVLFRECRRRNYNKRLSELPNETVVLSIFSRLNISMFAEDLSYVLQYLVENRKTIRSATSLIKRSLTSAGLSELEPEAVAMIAKSLSKGDIVNKQIFSCVEKSIYENYSTYPQHLVVDTLQSFEHANVLPRSLLTIATKEILGPGISWDKDSLSEFCVVLARLNRMPQRIATMVGGLLSKEEYILTLEQTVNFAWSLAICAPSILEEVWTNALETSQPCALGTSHLCLLHQISIACDLPVPEPLREQSLLAVTQGSSFVPGSNRFEYQVAKTLKAIGCDFREQYLIDGFRVDFVAQSRKKKWAIECNGSRFHYVNGDKKLGPRGEDILKFKILRKRGFQVIEITDTAWRRVRDREAWLLSRLRYA